MIHSFNVLCLSITLLMLLSNKLWAQTTGNRPDVIYKIDNTSIQAFISEVNDTEVVYRRASNPAGPIFRTRRSEIQSVRYANGETEEFTKASVAATPLPVEPTRSPYEPLRPSRYEPRPRYERPARQASSGGYAFERSRPVFIGGILFPSEITPFTAGVEFAASDDFGIGGRIWYWSKSGTSDITVQAIANYHLARAFNAQNAKIDPYLGLAIGKTFASYSGGGSESGDIAANLQLGFRYLVNEKVGPYAQLGLGIANKDQTYVFGNSSAVFELGVAVKLGR